MGDSLLTQDSGSGLEWLDITETAGLTFDFVVSELGTGGQFEGFRVATGQELDALATNGGMTPGNLTSNYAPVQILMSLLGCTSDCGAGSDDNYGRFASSQSAGFHDLYSFQIIPENPSGFAGLGGNAGDDAAASLFGTWLVRAFSPVPVEKTTWGSIKTQYR